MATQTAIDPHAQPGPIVRDRFYIGGEWVEPERARHARGRQLDDRGGHGQRPRGHAEPTSTARSRPRARPSRRGRRPAAEQRAELLGAIAEGLEERAEEIAALVARELGMPLAAVDDDPGRAAER